MAYVDAFLVPVYRSREDDYRKIATLGCQLWMEHGALSYHECRADDVPVGEVTSFTRAVQLAEDEVLYFAYVTYRDRAHRDEVNAKVMADPRAAASMHDYPANMQRMIFGGFQPVVSTD